MSDKLSSLTHRYKNKANSVDTARAARKAKRRQGQTWGQAVWASWPRSRLRNNTTWWKDGARGLGRVRSAREKAQSGSARRVSGRSGRCGGHRVSLSFSYLPSGSVASTGTGVKWFELYSARGGGRRPLCSARLDRARSRAQRGLAFGVCHFVPPFHACVLFRTDAESPWAGRTPSLPVPTGPQSAWDALCTRGICTDRPAIINILWVTLGTCEGLVPTRSVLWRVRSCSLTPWCPAV